MHVGGLSSFGERAHQVPNVRRHWCSLGLSTVPVLQNVCAGAGVRVDGFYGSQAPPGGLQKVDVAVCTIEKANSLVNRWVAALYR